MRVELCHNGLSKVDDFITDLLHKNLDEGARAAAKYELLKESLPEVTDEINERFMQDPDHDFVLENLQSHDAGKLLDVLNKKYGRFLKNAYCENENGKSVVYLAFNTVSDAELITGSDNDFKHILDFFNYYVTVRRNFIVWLEPRYSEKADEYIYGNCYGIVYHITNESNVKEIEETGLRCKTGSRRKTFYRVFPERIYVVGIDPHEAERNGLSVNEVLLGIRQKVAPPFDSMVALKINLRNRHIPFYRDSVMDDEFSCFTYNNIPPECIEKIIPLDL